MTERACRGFNARHAAVHDVPAQTRAVFAISLQPLFWKESALGQSSINNRRAVTFAQDEAITLRPTGRERIDFQDTAIKRRKQVSHAQACADVRGFCFVNHSQSVS